MLRMSGLDLVERLRAFLDGLEGIVCVYLFGSVARGSARPDSDVDVAVLFERDSPSTLAESGVGVSGELERRLGCAVDLVVLNRASADLVHRVLRDGIVVVDRDPSTRMRFEVRARNAYFDLKPVLDEYRRVRRRVGDG